MADTHTLLAGQAPTPIIEDEVIYLDNLNEVGRLSALSPWKMDYNAIVHCRCGRVLLELGGSQKVRVKSSQMLLVPAQKLMHPMMVSTDVEASALLVSDRVLKSVLGPQIDIWNRAMYLHETYVIDTRPWSDALYSQASSIFKGKDLALYEEFVLTLLRIFLLIVCEELLRLRQDVKVEGDDPGNREKLLFSSFLDLLQHERQKRRHVAFYANQLCITSKYLSKVCRNVSGKTPLRWIMDSVMEDSYQLLRNTDLTVKEISNQLGFPNSSFFGQYFREQAGMTPIAYRTKYKNQF